MHRFEKRAIRNWEKRTSKWIKGHIVFAIAALVVGILTLKGVVGAMEVGNPFSVKQIVISAVSNGIETDEYGHTNILLIGVGGEGHDGENLTDTMIIASIDHKNKLVPMLSIPRDFYVENDVVGWGTRINGVYEWVLEGTGDPQLAMDEFIGEIETMVDVDIHYYAKVDFTGFVDIVDAVGGVDVTLEESLYDPYYPAEYGNDLYQEFYLPAGEQTLDGDEALKFVRSRKTTSDFDRAQRQQMVISAIKDKATSLGFLLNPGKIKNTIAAVNNHFETNMTLSEMLSLANLAEDFDRSSIMSRVLSDDPTAVGGFLYTPEREEYGGAFVLVPYAGDNSEIQRFAQLYFYHPELFIDPLPLQVLNSTKRSGLAGLTKMFLHRYGFNVVAYGNAASIGAPSTSIFEAHPDVEEAIEGLEDTMEIIPSVVFGEILKETPNEYQPINWDSKADIIIELGADFGEYYEENNELFYVGFY